MSQHDAAHRFIELKEPGRVMVGGSDDPRAPGYRSYRDQEDDDGSEPASPPYAPSNNKRGTYASSRRQRLDSQGEDYHNHHNTDSDEEQSDSDEEQSNSDEEQSGRLPRRQARYS